MKPQADMVIYDSDGKLTLLVEVKSKLGTSKEWAAKMRRNLLAHGFMPKAPFFLLALPDRFYLWKNFQNSLEIVPPDYEIDVALFLQPYYQKIGIPLEKLSNEGFEIIVISWLNEILGIKKAPDLLQQHQEWIIESGLFKAIQRGSLVLPVAV